MYPGSVGIIIRRTSEKLRKNHIDPMKHKMFKKWPVLESYWREGTKTLVFPNGSILYFSYAEHEQDVEELFQGPEYGDICPEESGQFSEKELTMMRGANRSTDTPGFEPRILFTFNPKGRSHFYLKKIFIDGARDHRAEAYESMEDPKQFAFVQAYGWDNWKHAEPRLRKEGVTSDEYYSWPEAKRREYFIQGGYGASIASIKDQSLREAWLDGSWENFEGLVFPELKSDIHDLDKYISAGLFKYSPEHFKLIGSIDYGGSGTTAAVEVGCDRSEHALALGEYYEPDNRISVHAKGIAALFDSWAGRKSMKSPKHHGQEYILLDPNTAPDDKQLASAGIYSVQEEYNLNGIITVVVHRSPLSVGFNLIREYLFVDPNRRNPFTGKMGSPRAFISKSRCPNLWREIAELQKEYDEETHTMEYIGSDHALDNFRYILMSRPAVHILDENDLCPEEQDAWRRMQHQESSAVN